MLLPFALNTAAAPLPFHASRSLRVDTLRGVAILSVLVLHFTLAFGLLKSPLGDLLGKPLLGVLTLRGNYGVTLFFVISGFLITRQVLQRDGGLANIDLRRFYVERASRILPPLLLALAVIVLLGWVGGLPYFGSDQRGPPLPAQRWLIALASVLGFWHNLLMQQEGWGYFHYCLNVYWSLSVEEAFYLLFPLLCRLLKRPQWIALAAVALLVLGPVYRTLHPGNDIDFLYAYPACFDAIAAGVLCALASQRWRLPARWAAPVRWLAVAGMVAVWSQSFMAHPGWTFSALLGCTAIWLWASRGPQPVVVGWRGRLDSLLTPLRWLGRHSYELYLFHVLVLAGLLQFFQRDTLQPVQRLPLLAVFLLLSVLLASGVSRWVGEPALRFLRARWTVRAAARSRQSGAVA
ncbi:acyltransferase [Ideonella azotifigens]|uniref:Acyltransferase n=1 Tax=Ideonella azotifigens TaxID=513160 RepID=A0ABN1JHS9_9BURK